MTLCTSRAVATVTTTETATASPCRHRCHLFLFVRVFQVVIIPARCHWYPSHVSVPVMRCLVTRRGCRISSTYMTRWPSMVILTPAQQFSVPFNLSHELVCTAV